MRTGVIGVLAAITVAGAIISSGGAQAATTPEQKGLDVASYQHPGGASINWHEVASDGYKFVFIKATEGTYYVNPYYSSDRKSAEKNGLKVGAYAFAVPNRSPGVSGHAVCA